MTHHHDFWPLRQRPIPTSGVLLAYRQDPDVELLYEIHVHTRQSAHVAGESQELGGSRIEMQLRQATQEVHSDGQSRVSIEIASGRVVSNEGQSEQLPTVGDVYELRMRSNGEILESSLGFDLKMPVFPETGKRPGEAWVQQVELTVPIGLDTDGPSTREIPLEYRYRLTGIDDQDDDWPIAVVDVWNWQDGTPLTDQQRMSIRAQGRNRFAFAAGILVSSRVASVTEIEMEQGCIRTEVGTEIQLTQLSS